MKEYRIGRYFRHKSRYRPDSKYIGVYAYSPKIYYTHKETGEHFYTNGLKEYQEVEIVKDWINKHRNKFDIIDHQKMVYVAKSGYIYMFQRGGEFDRGMYYKKNIVLEERNE